MFKALARRQRTVAHVHESDMPGSKLIGAVSQGWPLILASLKSLLETGQSLEVTRNWPEGGGCATRQPTE